MIYTENTKKAMKLMFESHKDQVDKSGVPYVFHPWHVAESMEDEESCIVALLHDVVEDTEKTLEDIKVLGFNDNIIEALSLLTHKEEDSYDDYVEKLSNNSIAVRVKLSDLRHNSDLTRLEEVREKDLERVKKYQKHIKYLESK